MSAFSAERVLSVHHWDERVFSFRTTREASLRFENGQFVMVGLQVEDRPLMRAYSIASANYEPHLEFLSIKVPDGPLTSRLQHIKEGDEILVSRKPTGTLVLRDLRPGQRLYLLATGTGLAPFMGIIHDPETYAQFSKVVLVHGVRYRSELAYRDFLDWDLARHEYLGEAVRDQFMYYPTVTREPFRYEGRITTLMDTGKLQNDLGLPPLDPKSDRVMICGSMAMLDDLSVLLDKKGFEISPRVGERGDYVTERAFVSS